MPRETGIKPPAAKTKSKETGSKRKSADAPAVSNQKKPRHYMDLTHAKTLVKRKVESDSKDKIKVNRNSIQKADVSKMLEMTKKVEIYTSKEKKKTGKKKECDLSKGKIMASQSRKGKNVVKKIITNNTVVDDIRSGDSYLIRTEESSSSSDFEEVPSQHLFKTPDSVFKDSFSADSISVKSSSLAAASSTSTYWDSGYSCKYTHSTSKGTHLESDLSAAGASYSSCTSYTGSSFTSGSHSCGDSCDCGESQCDCSSSVSSFSSPSPHALKPALSKGGSKKEKGHDNKITVCRTKVASPVPSASSERGSKIEKGQDNKITACQTKVASLAPAKTAIPTLGKVSKKIQNEMVDKNAAVHVKRKSQQRKQEIKADASKQQKEKRGKTIEKDKGGKPSSSAAAPGKKEAAKRVGIKAVSSETDANDVLAVLMRMEGQSTSLQHGKSQRLRPSTSTAGQSSSIKTARLGKKAAALLLHSESEDSEWEEVEDFHHSPVKSQIPDAPVEITIEDPGIMHRKRKTKEFDWKAYVERKIKRLAREIQIDMHKANLLCLLSHGLQQNTVCNDETVCAMALSIIPPVHLQRPLKDYDGHAILQVLRWYKQKIHLSVSNWEETRSLVSASQLMNVIATSSAAEMRIFVMVFVSMLRSMGLTVRLVLSVHPLPIRNTLSSRGKPETKTLQKASKSKKRKENAAKSSNSNLTSKGRTLKSSKSRITGSKKIADCSLDSDDSSHEHVKTKRRVPLRGEKSVRKNTSGFAYEDGKGGCDSDMESNFSDEEESAPKTTKRRKGPEKIAANICTTMAAKE